MIMLLRVYEKTMLDNCEHFTMTDRTVMVSPDQYSELDMGREVIVKIVVPDTPGFFSSRKSLSMGTQTLRLNPCFIRGNYYGPMGKLMGVTAEKLKS